MARYEVVVNTVVPDAPDGGVSVRRTVTAASHCAAVEQVAELVVADGMVGIWCARRRGLFGLGRRRSGQIDRSGGDGLAGVREPRRPMPSAGAGDIALDLPAA